MCTRVYGEVKSGSQPPRKSANLLCWGVCQELRFSKPQSAPKPILPHQQTPTAAAGCEQNHSCLRAEGISWPGLDYPSLGRSAALGAESIPASGRKGFRPQAGIQESSKTPCSGDPVRAGLSLGLHSSCNWPIKCDSMVHGKLEMRNSHSEFLISSFSMDHAVTLDGPVAAAVETQ